MLLVVFIQEGQSKVVIALIGSDFGVHQFGLFQPLLGLLVIPPRFQGLFIAESCSRQGRIGRFPLPQFQIFGGSHRQ